MKAMDSREIANILSRNNVTRPFFRGVCPSDKMIFASPPYCFVANVDKSDEPGSHWTAWFIDYDGVISFFDSYGRSPRDSMFPAEFRLFASRSRFRFNPRILESVDGVTCGHFCIFMLYFKALGFDLKPIYNYFWDDLEYNDIFVYNFVKQL